MKTVLELLREITGTSAEAVEIWGTVARWPADAFAVTAAILADSGAYRRVVSPPEGLTWPPEDVPPWEETIERVASDWIGWCENQIVSPDARVPSPVATLCARLATNSVLQVTDLGSIGCWSVVTDLLTLQATADLACAELGLSRVGEKAPWKYTVRAGTLLSMRGTLANLPIDRVRVLPKTRTPQLGITLRSLSHHVAMCRSEVGIQWIRTAYPEEIDRLMRLRVLLFPWPFEVARNAFSPATTRLANMRADKFGFFEFAPRYRADDLFARLAGALDSAAKDVGNLDFVVLPEGAVTDAEFEEIWKICAARNVHVLLSGVRVPNRNQAWLRTGLKDLQTYKQDKHHRWCLDDSQISTYDLGERLHPSRRWWEAMDIEPRALTFVAFNDWLTFCHLICEDLARIDPVSQIVRAVGPTLVVALLLDGPQLPSRWPARYATVLADDPGSSVLTLTALGMALRSRTKEHPEPNPTIALWKDSKRGDVPIKIDPTCDAVVLTLWADRHEEFAADGRSDGGMAGRLVLGGVTQIRGSGWSAS